MIYTSGDFNWLKIFFFCIYKMYPISAEGYKNVRVHLLIIKKCWNLGQYEKSTW